ncbi:MULTISPECIES: hypothetical protein [Enterobacterales]|uniref:hypothetical protein n=1 Tax=Enterobacterales TaxID=91347 RepID=UPI002EDB811F
MKKHLTIALLIFFFSSADAEECSHNSLRCMSTILGPLRQTTKSEAKDGFSHFTLDKKEIYKAKTDYMVINDYDTTLRNEKYLMTKAVISYTSHIPCNQFNPIFYCNISIIIDLTNSKPIVSNTFTSETGDSHIDWVSWGKSNSIIVFKDESKFKYADGHVEKVTKEKDAADENDAKK